MLPIGRMIPIGSPGAITFSSSPRKAPTGIFALTVRAKAKRRSPTPKQHWRTHYPAMWPRAGSYDGAAIAHLSSRRDEDTGPWRLWVMNADGGGKRPLDTGVEIDYSFASEQVVSWGPQVK